MRDLITNNFVRGAVSGLGVVNLFAGLLELAEIFARSSALPESLGHAEPGGGAAGGLGPRDHRAP